MKQWNGESPLVLDDLGKEDKTDVLIPLVLIRSKEPGGGRSEHLNYHPLPFLSCPSKSFEVILNRKVFKRLPFSHHLSDRHYRFRKERSSGGLALPTGSWSPSLNQCGETFPVTLDVSKGFDRI